MTFLDIETVPQFKEQPQNTLGLLFEKKVRHEEKSAFELWPEKASIHAEFGKVICVSLGIIIADKLRIKTLYNRDEKELLKQLSEILGKTKSACAHNGLEFDFPFLMRRYIINGLPLPELLQIAGKKPWELQL